MQYLSVLFTFLFVSIISGKSPTIPDELKPWVAWVKEEKPNSECVALGDSTSCCAWGGVLRLAVDERGVVFSQEWAMLAEHAVELPGSQKFWPEKVTSGKKEIPVFSRGAFPAIVLSAGRHTITGAIRWKKIPESISIPQNSVLISLTISGRTIDRINRDAEGRLWFGQSETTVEPEENVEETSLQIFRKITDGEPPFINSNLHLLISGAPRELLIGRFLPDNTAPLSLESPLPARIEKDGNLRIQVRPGSFEVNLTSRMLAATDTFRVSGATEFWPQEEIWSFEANNQLRVVTVSGGQQIDPAQTSMPTEWHRFPAYYLKNGAPLIIIEEHRGDWSPAPDELTLTREFWLDFNGKGFTVKDYLSGVISKSSRLECEHDMMPGSISLNNEPVLITTSDSMTAGTEVKKGDLALTALSRYQKKTHHLTLSGWKHSFREVTTTLHLPPGWRLFSAGGVGAVENSWIDSWNLWELFLALVLTVALIKLLGAGYGIIAAVTFALTFQEGGAPVYSWAFLTGAFALVKYLPFVRTRLPLAVFFSLCFIFVAGTTLIFSIQKFRLALYPQLQVDNTIQFDFYEPTAPEETAARTLSDVETPAPGVESKMEFGSNYQSIRRSAKIEPRYDVNAKIQTGPGEPSWQWDLASWRSEGPVETGETMTISLISPAITRLVNIIAPLCILLLLYGFINRFRKTGPVQYSRKTNPAPTLALLLSLAALFAPRTTLAAFPDEEMLAELKQRLSRTEICTTDCAAMNRGTVSVAFDIITISLTFSAQKQTAFPIPNSGNWAPSEVRFGGGNVAPVFSKATNPLILLPAGVTTLVLKGPVKGNQVQVSFPFTVHNLDFVADTWTAQGLVDGQLQSGSLTLQNTGTAAMSEETEKRLLPDPAPVFCIVERTFSIDKEWYITTTVTRMAPLRGALSLAIPLVKGEAITSEKTVVRNDTALIALLDNESTTSWTSRLERKSQFTLVAPATNDWREVWRLSSSTIWHLEFNGLIPVKTGGISNEQRWYPRPGEKLHISAIRPKAVDGPTRTIEKLSLNYKPGKKSSETTMALSVKSSNGDKLPVTLPPGATLDKVIIDNKESIVSHGNGKLDVPLYPGVQEIAISWKEPRGAGIRISTPSPKINDAIANVSLSMQVPADRWPVFTAGPQLGPAVQFWGIMVALVIVAFILAAARCTPLAAWQWILLFIGLSTINNLGGIAIVLWFIALKAKEKHHGTIPAHLFNPLQVLLIILSVAALVSLVASVPFGLLSVPTMQISGNGSSARLLNWFADSGPGPSMPQGTLISFPLWVYRLVMLAWSLWLAISLPKWLSWAWKAFSQGGFWHSVPKNEKSATGETKL